MAAVQTEAVPQGFMAEVGIPRGKIHDRPRAALVLLRIALQTRIGGFEGPPHPALLPVGVNQETEFPWTQPWVRSQRMLGENANS